MDFLYDQFKKRQQKPEIELDQRTAATDARQQSAPICRRKNIQPLEEPVPKHHTAQHHAQPNRYPVPVKNQCTRQLSDGRSGTPGADRELSAAEEEASVCPLVAAGYFPKLPQRAI